MFEALAYFVAFRIQLRQRRKGDFLDTPARWSVVAAAICGAAIGWKVLAWAEDPASIPTIGSLLRHWELSGT